MQQEERAVCYDEQLAIETYYLGGIVQSFPAHFHDHYVIGFVQQGERRLFCGSREYDIEKGSIVLFHPGESHSCIQKGEAPFGYRGMNIGKEAMEALAGEMACSLPEFFQPVIEDEELLCYLQRIHMQLMKQSSQFEKEENLLLMLSLLMERYGGSPAVRDVSSGREEVDQACRFLKEHFAERIYLEQICERAYLSKTALIRAFTREKGVTPYRYLESIRINEAKKLLERGIPAAEVALHTGFSDQSHFTNFFRMFIGLTPGAYKDMFVKGKNGSYAGRKGGQHHYGA